MINCYNNGEIIGVDRAGGICGQNEYGKIEMCYNVKKVSGNSFIGGITGHNLGGTIDISYNTGEIIGDSTNIGGVVGKNYENATLKNTYNKGKINASGEKIGGIIGYNQDSAVYNCYNIGSITTNNATNIGCVVGDVIGSYLVKNNFSIENIVNSTNGATMEGVIITTIEDMKKNYSTLGVSFKQDINNINDGYPIFNWQ